MQSGSGARTFNARVVGKTAYNGAYIVFSCRQMKELILWGLALVWAPRPGLEPGTCGLTEAATPRSMATSSKNPN